MTLGNDDRQVVIRYLECLNKPTLKGPWDCPCGSHKRIRNCHQATLNALRAKIPPSTAQYSCVQLKSDELLNDPF